MSKIAAFKLQNKVKNIKEFMNIILLNVNYNK